MTSINRYYGSMLLTISLSVYKLSHHSISYISLVGKKLFNLALYIYVTQLVTGIINTVLCISQVSTGVYPEHLVAINMIPSLIAIAGGTLSLMYFFGLCG